MSDQARLGQVCRATDRFFAWLAEDALPLWSTVGVDWKNGGFIERLDPDGMVVADVRRARLVARQIFAFASAGNLGWAGPVDLLVDHGLTALLTRHLTHALDVVPCYIPAEDRGEGAFDLYDQAFVLFGLAHGYAHTGDEKLLTTASTMLAKLRAVWGLPAGGFAEHRPPQAPLKANPHMHLLEAGLAWLDASAEPTWRDFCEELVGLCLSRFIDPDTGSLHEYFATDWSLIDGADDVVEPGHQVEWAWLLRRWDAIQPGTELVDAASRLVAIAEGAGLNRTQNRLFNELSADLSVRDHRLRLWPQTERIKSLVMEYEQAPSSEIAGRIATATHALLGYFQHPIAGSWWEHFDEAGDPIVEPARASSLYHIMGAANELARLTGLSLG